MFYVEWLRVRNCLRILAIVFGVLFAGAAITRIAVNAQMYQTQTWVAQEMAKPGARVSHDRLSDGATRTTVDIPSDGDHIVIVDRGWHGKAITISGPSITNDRNVNAQIGSVRVRAIRSTPQGGSIEIETDEAISARVLLLLSAFVALVIGTVLAGPLAKENGNHLEIAWTKPIGRERLALGLFAVDAAGMLAAMAMTIAFLLIGTALFELPRVVVDSQTLAVLALSVFMPFAWYALLTAASASLKRGLGAIVGLGWLAALILPGIAIGLSHAEMPFFHAAGIALSYLSLLDPLVYMHLSASAAPGDVNPAVGYMFGALSSTAMTRAAILLGLTILYSALSLVQWRRLEA